MRRCILVEGGTSTHIDFEPLPFVLDSFFFWGRGETLRILRSLESVEATNEFEDCDSLLVVDVDSRAVQFYNSQSEHEIPRVQWLKQKIYDAQWPGYTLNELSAPSEFFSRNCDTNVVSADAISRTSDREVVGIDYSETNAWVAVKVDQDFSHYVIRDLPARLAKEGIQCVERCHSLGAHPPNEQEIELGALIDPISQTVSVWGWEPDTAFWSELRSRNAGWNFSTVDADGYRWQFRHVLGDPSSLVSDAELIGPVIRKELESPVSMLDQMESLVRNGTHRLLFVGSGCLGVMLLVPFGIIGLLSQRWDFVFVGFAASWLGLVFFAWMKVRALNASVEKFYRADFGDHCFPGPRSASDRLAEVERILQAAGLENCLPPDKY